MRASWQERDFTCAPLMQAGVAVLSKPSDSQPQQATLPPYSGNDAKTPVISQPPAIQAYGTGEQGEMHLLPLA